MDTLHPMAVHFPIAFAITWPLFDALAFWVRSAVLDRLSLGLLAVTVVFSAVATATGQAAFETALDRGTPPELLHPHTEDANLVPWALLLVLGLRYGLERKLGKAGRLVALAGGLAVAGFVGSVANSGGTLVYEHGIGIRASVEGATVKPR